MSKLMFELALPDTAVALDDQHKLRVELSNGVRLTTSVPEWVEHVIEAKLVLEMEVKGSPPDADAGKPPVK